MILRFREEVEALGIPLKPHFSRLDESIELMRLMRSGLTCTGRWGFPASAGVCAGSGFAGRGMGH